MKLKLIVLVSLFAFGLATSAFAGSTTDTDGDLVPDGFDNCDTDDNGPNELANQADTDSDGYGNACDADYDNDLAVTAADFGTFLATFGGVGTETDHDGDGAVTAADFGVFLSQFGGPPGTSGLSCAGTVPCTP
ncbi:MAG: hypothetical protein CL908_01320 [Deltaproteobacteria bacterium]|nr:hypothetical protein [Deltaproteobacteria bacterium]